MLATIVATDKDGLDVRTLTITLDVFNNDIDVEKAVIDACTEYCKTEEGRWTYCECNCFNFNWGDFTTYVPNEICEKHGFKIIDTAQVEELCFDFNQQLVDEDDVMDYE